MIKESPKILPSKEEEATKKLEAIAEAKERENALESVVRELMESMSEEELDRVYKEAMEKVKRQRELKPEDQ